MERTPDEIKKGLECCGTGKYGNHKDCPYDIAEPQCMHRLLADAIALIQQIQAENTEKDQRIRTLERSRSFAADLADGLKAATVKQEQEIYVLVERNRQIEAQNAELLKKVEQLQAERDAAVGDINEMVMQTGFIACDWCDHCDCESDCSWSSSNPGFKWRGVQT